MTRKREISQETEMEQVVPQDNSPNTSEDQPDIIESWAELQRVLDGASTDELFEKGWRPLLKSKPNGKQYITLRLHGRDPETGHQIDTERGLGLHNPETPERWETLVALYEAAKPQLPCVAPKTNSQPISSVNKSSIFATKVARMQPIGPTVNLGLDTLYWYMWVQKARGYDKSLDNFINDCVSTLFTIHYKKELAVVNLRDENH